MESSSLKRLGTRSLAITSSAAMLVGLTAAGAAAAPTAPLASEDTDAPNLVSFEVDPTEYNLDEGEAVIKVTAKITDATGVDRTTEDGDPIDPVLFAQSTSSSHRSDNIALDLVAGTATDGTYEGTLTIPVGSAAGDWQINLVSLGDTLGNEVAAAEKENVGAFSLKYNEVIDLTAEYDFFQDEAGTDNDSFTIPDIEGVTFRVDGTVVAPGRYTGQAEGAVSIVATAEAGYEFSEDLGIRDEESGDYVSEGLVSLSENEATWTHEFNVVTPADVQFFDRTGSQGDVYVIPDVEGVSYYLGSYVPGESEALEAGEHAGVGTVTVVAVADEGYELAADAQTSWTDTFETGYEQVVTGDVAISGDAQVGEALAAVTEDNLDTDAKWGPEAGVEFSYQWFAQDVPAEGEELTAPEAIEGATAATFIPTVDQLGQTITVEVTGSLDGYQPSEAVTSMSTDAVAEGYLTAATPAIKGAAQVGETLTADAGEWGQEGVELAYQWNADGKAIEGATGTTLELTEENLGQKITVTVTGSLENYLDTSVTSAATAAVAEAEAEVTFSDVNEENWFFSPVMWMVDNDITTGYKDGTFGPYKAVTRGEAVTFLFRYADEEFTAPESIELTDVPSDHNFFEAIAWATENGVVNGYSDNSFRSGHNMTRAEVAAVLYRQADVDYTAPDESPFTDVTPEHNQYEAISWLAENEIALGNTDGSFDPYADISRAEIAAFLERYNNVLSN
ncbi:S-layer homology domain-containing protein [Citricoccus nitrophenolicus]|uniref:S-layer homology domain-containing protein n=1 Tax=Citricoccus nitrophenolicus TaxID=863575 RepID=A0ABV0IHX5_9MICC